VIALVVGAETQHGVTAYARDVAEAVQRLEPEVAIVGPESLAAEIPPTRAHLHFTDRLWASSPEEAAARIETLAQRTALTVTLHDLPQTSDGERNLPRRVDAYRRVAAAARGVVCNSRHEAGLLAEFVGPVATVGVIPLAVDAHPAPHVRPAGDGTAAVLGFFYPGKGHAEVVEAVAGGPVAGSGPGAGRLGWRGVTVLGRSSPGHEAELEAMVRAAAERGVVVDVTGYLSDADLLTRCRSVSVPVAAHRHVSASGSIATWIAAGRRPIVPDTRYSREMAELRPGTLRLVGRDGLQAALEDALAHPESTWSDADATTAPDTGDVARAYLSWWRDAVVW